VTSPSIKVERFSLSLHETNGQFVLILFDISSLISLSKHRVIHNSELVFFFRRSSHRRCCRDYGVSPRFDPLTAQDTRVIADFFFFYFDMIRHAIHAVT
jgi:hypothetical protein